MKYEPKIPLDIRHQIRIRAKKLLSLHRLNRKHSVGIDVVQGMLEIMGEATVKDLFEAALNELRRQDQMKGKK